MAEPILKRVHRVVSASLESAADAAERISGTSMMRHAVREVEQTITKIAASRDAALARREQAERQQKLLHERLKQLDEDARFAITKGRDDLAEAVVARQLDCEADLERFRSVQAEAAKEAARLDDSVDALSARKTQMENELAAIEVVRREAGSSETGSHVDRKVKRAEAAFERARAATADTCIVVESGTSAELAELKSLRKSTLVAERMATLKAAPSGQASKRARPAANKRSAGSKRG